MLAGWPFLLFGIAQMQYEEGGFLKGMGLLILPFVLMVAGAFLAAEPSKPDQPAWKQMLHGALIPVAIIAALVITFYILRLLGYMG